METAASEPGRNNLSAESRGVARTITAFGLDVQSEVALPFLGESLARPSGRVLDLSVRAGAVAQLDWPASAEVVCDERQTDGRSIFSIESHPTDGYLISGPEYGFHLLSSDGRRLTCVPEGRPEDAWQRLLIAQVLPFAALLRGLEVFHASAVVSDLGAVALLGPSRAGKTSLALELCRRGAHFLADDVLVVEAPDGQLIAHPGTAVAGAARDQAEPLLGSEPPPEQPVLAVNAREQLVSMTGAAEPARLAALFFLDRRAEGPEHPSFEPIADAELLLSATFNFVLATPQRLRGLLDVCALAAQLHVERILVGPGTSVSELGAVIEQRLESVA
jgi:hypothetical protein